MDSTLPQQWLSYDTMVINPTYLAQRTRSCTNSIRFRTLGEKGCGLMRHSDELARCATEGIPCLPTMAKIGQLRKMNTARCSRADLRPCIRLLKSNKCIHSICPYLSYERKYDKSLRDTDMSTSCRWWTCCCSRVTPSFRYIALLVHSRRLHAGRLSNHRVKSPEWMLMPHTTGNAELLEADTTRYEIFPGNRESDSKIAYRFHARLSGGRNCGYSSGIKFG